MHGYSHSLFLALLLPSMLLAPACSDDDKDPGSPQPEVGLPFPDTPEQLVANLEAVYEAKDAGGLMDLYSEDFLFILKESTTADFPEMGTFLDTVEEQRIHQKMFAGEDGTTAEGSPCKPISTIEWNAPIQTSGWETSPPDDPIPGVTSALFAVIALFNRVGDYTLEVKGLVKFYVTSRDSLHDGVVRPYHQFRGMWDFTEDKGKDATGLEGNSFGAVKALFR